ncbi:MAG: 4-(cytidine 5'-diphospho)-2-C-methyl-D-erythritol kinase [Elusimicrobia bacterium]|nr:4-(cytidine 5'-diphospho)-2-C-methyl-D-erythritol kinase [Elusimicrobiota bacterium]
MLKLKAPAKINLFLETVRRRPDGYHDLATLFARTGVCDTLSFSRKAAAGIKLSVKGGPRELGRPEDNIIHKAAVKFFATFNLDPAVEITLEKVIPVGAGLGGGSSDAATALLGLAKLYKIGRSGAAKLMKIAAAVGSDVPFFMLEAMAAEGRGRGERLRPFKPRGRLPYVVLAYPGVPVYTKEVYGNLQLGSTAEIKARVKDFGRLCRLLRAGKFGKADAGLLFNRLEGPVLPRHKAVRQAKERLAALGADAVMMSGSGATVFALCWNRAAAARVAAGAGRIRGYRVFLTNFW